MTNPSPQEPIQHPEKNNTKNKSVHYGALLIVSVMSAWAAGRMIGISQHDSIVIAAVIPVLLSAGWGIISLKVAAVDNNSIDTNLIAITAAMVLFLYVMTYSANSSQHDEEEKRNEKYFEKCSYNEFHVNKAREVLGLPPLESEYFCYK